MGSLRVITLDSFAPKIIFHLCCRSIDAFVGQSNTLDAMINIETKYCEKLLLHRENRFSGKTTRFYK